MARPWVNNEDGPLCSCGFGLTVKEDGRGGFGLLCFGHTAAAGAWIALPDEAPDTFIAYAGDGDEDAPDPREFCRQEIVNGTVGAFVPKAFAEHFRKILAEVIETGVVPEYYKPALVALHNTVYTAEATPRMEDSL